MAKRILALMRLMVCLSLFLAPCTYAASTTEAVEPIAVSQKCTLTMTYAYKGKAFSGVSVKLYKIADVSADYQYEFAADFAPTNLQLNGVASAGEWKTICTTLEAYVAANSLETCAVKATDKDGQAVFDELVPGLYMFATVQHPEGGSRYTFASGLVALPALQDDGTWNYDVNAKPKADVYTPGGGGGGSSSSDDVRYRVLKLWKDGESARQRPASVEVEIMKNGKVVKTVVLSAANNWAYSWYADDDDSIWQVAEKNVPDGYVMTVEKRTTTFSIVNSWPDKPDKPGEPDKPNEPGEPDKPGEPDEPDKPGTPDTPNKPDKPGITNTENMPTNPDVPKTGDTFNVGLYVVLMCVSGMVLVLLSVTGKRREE